MKNPFGTRLPRTSEENPYLKIPPTAPLARPDLSHEQDFYSRSASLQTNARNILTGMIALLIAGAVVFVAAPLITYLDLSILTPTDYNSRFAANKKRQRLAVEENARIIGARNEKMKLLIYKLNQYLEAEIKKNRQERSPPKTIDRPPMNVPGVSEGQPEAAIQSAIKGWAEMPDRSIPVCSSINISDVSGQYTVGGCLKIDAWHDMFKDLAKFDPEDVKALHELSVELERNSDEQQLLSVVAQNLVSTEAATLAGSGKRANIEKKETLDGVVQTSITRFGFLAVVTFLVAILGPLYRYNKRLAAFYMARGDALRFKREGMYESDFREMSSALTPPYDFGKPPKMPLEQVVEIIKAARKE